MTQLLVSVRSVLEAETAIAAGADIIDIKEPSRGSLGRADDDVIAAVTAAVGDRALVSAALGELQPHPPRVPPGFPGFLKVGLGGCCQRPDWRQLLGQLLPETEVPAAQQLVAVAYADAERAQAPDIFDVVDFAIAVGLPVMLVDTWQKDGRGLLAWVTFERLQQIRTICSRRGIRLALAGSLSRNDIEQLLPLGPDIIAVRGAACRHGQRDSEIDFTAVTTLARLCASRHPR